MNPKTNFKARLLCLVLVLTMLLSPVFTLVSGATGLGSSSGASSGRGHGSLEDVSGKYDFADSTKGFGDQVKKNPKDPDKEYWVFVHLEGSPVNDVYKASGSTLSLTEYATSEEGIVQEKALLATQAAFLEKLAASGLSYTEKYSYTLFSNAVAVKILYRDVEKLSAMDGVRKVTFSEHYAEPDAVTENNANVYRTGIYNTDGIGYDGTGLVVAVLDTGLDQSHIAFRTMPNSFSMKRADVLARIFDGNTSAGLLKFDRRTTIDDVYYNAKVPFAYDYADKDAVVYPSYSVHGTHVAGIIAGNTGDATDEPIRDADGNPILGQDGQPLTFRGVAPEAQLVICKVFTDKEDNDSLGGAETVDILAALEDCVKLGVDVINMSLGSSAGFSEGDDEMAPVYESIRAAGISLVVAASNDYSSAYGSNTGTNLTKNPDSATVGSPSTFEEALSVASISGQKSQYLLSSDGSVIFFNEVSDGNGNKKEFVKELLAKAGKTADGKATLPFVAVQLYGQMAGYTGLDVKDKIVLVERGGGGMTFEEKVRIAKQKGALAVIIYNNVSGNINMTIGGVSDIPVCSITMDASKSLLASIDRKREGTLEISTENLGGPFMSDFSSWGPTPSLRLKPEITAHGGDITSAVPGGWDTLSGTSMAAPNMAGAYTLVLQYLKEKFPSMSKGDRVTLANRLVMSTPVIAYDEFGTPYSPRKQGAGLASIKNAVTTAAYLWVEGTDKTKIELGDDKTKSGVYELKFHLCNLEDGEKTYELSALIMTETVTSDKNGVKTVAEHAYMLGDMCTVEYYVDGEKVTDGKVTVGAGADKNITAKITLGDDARTYLDENFENGMYVEGFIRLVDTAEENAVNLSVPFLGFYGDWYAAPMFDMSAFEEDKIKQDDSIPDDEKPQAAVYPTVPLGSYYNGKYIIPLGTYLYELPSYMTKTIYSSEDKVAVSMYDGTNHHTVYQLYSVYTGLLRGAKYMDVKITDATTGEVIYEERQTNIRKAYSGGSTTASAANVLLELSPLTLGLANNRKYLFEMSGVMDKVVGESDYPASRPEDSFSFTFYVDNEAPEITDYRVRFDPYKDGKETKYKVYLDVDVYDNHYAQSLALCYLDTDEMELQLLTGEWIPVETARGGSTTVSLDITDYYDSDIELYVQVDDYAMNTRAYRLSDWKTLAEAVTYPDEVRIDESSVTMDIGEARTLGLTVSPSTAASTNLYWTSSNEKVVKVKNGELYAVGAGTATVTVYAAPNTATQTKASVRVTVTNKTSGKTVRLKALHMDLIRNGEGALVDPTNLTDVHPNTTYVLKVTTDPWYYPEEVEIRFESSAPDVAEVNEKTGVVHTLREGSAYITATPYVNGKALAISATAKLNVGPEFVVKNGVLRSYHGLGGKVVIPKSLNVYYIDEDAFEGNNNVTELEISSPCMEIRHNAFANMTALRRVVIPQSVTYVASDAFRGCTALEQVDLRSRAITFGNRAFDGCTSLKYINNLVVTDKAVDTKVANILDLDASQYTRTTPKIGTLGDAAFRGCTSLRSVDITELRVSGDNVFEGCTSLEEVFMSSHTVLGDEMFSGDGKLTTLHFTDSDTIVTGGATLPFAGCRVSVLNFANGQDGVYYKHTDGCYYTDSTLSELVFAPQTLTSYKAPDTLRKIDAGAFAGNTGLRTVDLGSVTSVGAYALANTGLVYSSAPLLVPATVTEIGEGVFYACSELKNVGFAASVSELPARTFALSGLESITLSGSVRRIGDEAFRYTDLVTLDLRSTSVTELGNRVFSYTYRLKAVHLPALTKVGSNTFYYAPDASFTAPSGSYGLTTVTFADGTTDIGTGTFYSYGGFSSLTTVTLPDSVKENMTSVGALTFYGCTALTSLNLGALTDVGDFAFYGCKALTGLDLSAVKTVGSYAFDGCAALTVGELSEARYIGDFAFAGTAVTSVNLSSCLSVGKSAFADSRLSSVTGTAALTYLGDYAFANTKLSGTFTFPASLTEKAGRIGKGVFIGTEVDTLATEHDGAYFVRDGILFSVLPNGTVQLDMCPPAREGTAYTVPADVTRVADDAFRTVKNLTKVTFSDGILSIGDKAFYKCGAKEFVFLGLNAPVLETYIANVFATDAERYIFSGVTGISSSDAKAKAEEKYYANFSDYAALVLHSDLSGVESLGLTLSYPSNAVGFDGRIWNLFFADANKTDAIAEPATVAAIEAIAAVPDAGEIARLASMTDKTEAKALFDSYKALIHDARVAYNAVTNAEQKAFITDSERLFAAEAAFRTVRPVFGETVTIANLRVKKSPTKLTYVDGDMFDASGMILTVIYDDGSEEDVSEGFTLPTTPLYAGQQTVVFSYKGVEKEISLTVNNRPSGPDTPDTPDDPSTPDTPDTPTDNGGLPTVAVVFIVLGSVIVLAGAGAAVYFFLIRKKRQ